MKHFLINITYTAPLSTIDRILPDHRKFLQEGYNSGLLLMSGPKSPRKGGIVLARSSSMELIKAFFNKDPYRINDCAIYEFIEFDPVKHQPLLDEWILGR